MKSSAERSGGGEGDRSRKVVGKVGKVVGKGKSVPVQRMER